MQMKLTLLNLIFSVCFSISYLKTNATYAKSAHLNGAWVATSKVSTGVYSDREVDVVDPLEGMRIVIEGQNLHLAQDVICLISRSYPEVLVNDMRTFGSFGGDWSDLGLIAADGENFEVIRHEMECPDANQPRLSIVAQPQHEVVLLGAFRVFVRLQPSE